MTKRRTTHASVQWMPGGILWPALLPFLRVALVALAALATTGLIAATGQQVGPASAAVLGAAYLLPVNIISLIAVRRLVHRDGGTLRSMIDYRRDRLGRDILWGLLWIAVLYVPFALAIIGTMAVLFGADAFSQFGAVFAPDLSTTPVMSAGVSIAFAAIVLLTFAPLNAPAEELVFRGYSQGGLQRTRPILGILLPSVAFGLQHVFFALTVPGMLVYAVAFFVWGVGSALIYRRQGRLLPLIIAHAIVNLCFSAPALILPFVLPA
ncbi:CPBP family intramembrane glutamic endopeptidase [Diaminobutyricimonas sp. TR449]|uniref:CPBP family intramembrane glutamic endopeptidase n=1 Tax=Diaminobutyricimonas sp. TR449 TaxID=2708076 RepID=UPI00142466AD|nr:CPBP family intramembrane glutamic endopeptidase [Diaminobutyricimonas sp. TR449]